MKVFSQGNNRIWDMTHHRAFKEATISHSFIILDYRFELLRKKGFLAIHWIYKLSCHKIPAVIMACCRRVFNPTLYIIINSGHLENALRNVWYRCPSFSNWAIENWLLKLRSLAFKRSSEKDKLRNYIRAKSLLIYDLTWVFMFYWIY